MVIGMLWAISGKEVKDITVAKTYYATKYGRIPDTMEIHPSFLEVLEIDGTTKSYDGLNIIRTKSVINGCILLGVEKDTDNSHYLVEEK